MCRTFRDDDAVFREFSKVVIQRVAHVFEAIPQRKIEGRNLIVREAVHLAEPLVDALVVFPVLAHRERSNVLAVALIAVFRNRPHHPWSVPLDEVEPESIESDLLDRHLRIFHHACVNQRIAMAQVRETREYLALEGCLITARMEAVPVPWKTSAHWLEFRPARLAIQG